jgi:hypothetical protein
MRAKTSPAVVIPAAAPGAKTRSFGPKSLFRLGDGQTLVRRQVAAVRAVWPRADVVVVVGYEAERLIKGLPAGVRVVENEHFEQTGAARSVLMGLRATVADRVLVAYGDLAFDEQAVRALDRDASCVLADRAGRMPVGLTADRGLVGHFHYGLPTRWGEMVLLTGRELALFKSLAAHPDRRQLLTFEVLNAVIDKGGEFTLVRSRDARLATVASVRDAEAL